MARRRWRSRRADGRSAGAALKGLIQSIAERVVERARNEMPGRDQFRALETQLRRLSREVAKGFSRTGLRRVGRPPSNRRCKVSRCGLPHVAHGFCSKHYQAWRRKNLAAAPPRASQRRRSG